MPNFIILKVNNYAKICAYFKTYVCAPQDKKFKFSIGDFH